MYDNSFNRHFISKQQVIDYAQRTIENSPLYLDTETTGLDFNDEIIEIAIVDSSGKSLFDSFIRPIRQIPPSATAINHITNEMVSNSPTWVEIWPVVKNILRGKLIGMYNAEFDTRMILQSLRLNNIPDQDKFRAFDIMKVYSDFMKTDRRFRLEQAGRNLGIPIPNSHRALDDTLLTRAVFHSIAGVSY